MTEIPRRIVIWINQVHDRLHDTDVDLDPMTADIATEADLCTGAGLRLDTAVTVCATDDHQTDEVSSSMRIYASCYVSGDLYPMILLE